MRRLVITKVAISLACIFSLTSCSTSNESGFPEQYITFTFTHITDQEDEFEMNTYDYDFQKDELKQVATIQYGSQYPLTYYDKQKNVVYYTTKTKENNDEIFEYNCENKQSRKMTNKLFAVNAMVKISPNKLALVAVSKQLLQLWILDVETLELKEITMDDYMISAQSYREKTHSILLAGYSDSKEWELRNAYNEDEIDSYVVEYVVSEYHFDTGKQEEIFKESDGEIITMVGNDQVIYYKIMDPMSAKTKIMLYDRNTKKTTEVTNMGNIYQLIGISEDSQEILYNTGSSMNIFNVKTGKSTSLFTVDVAGQINNGFLCENNN
ncbi:hypothetical protein [[Eubacterium] hominis]|uniref:hypothetical protein n=1 Tax=[Eubacterium] hominis TaxID=2764325 RepID=UPI003A4D327C